MTILISERSIAKLSISRLFCSYWDKGSAVSGPSLQELDWTECCSRWIATYEAFIVKESHSDSYCRRTIPLPPEEIEVCLRQSLYLSPINHFKCHFPMSIGPQLDHFTILNRLYRIDGVRSEIKNVRFPIPHHPRLERSWSRGRPLSMQHYTYKLEWSHRGQYLAFSDLDDTAEDLQQVFTCIFSVSSTEHGPTIQLVNHVFRKSSWAGMIKSICFHPVADVVILLEDTYVYQWEFGECWCHAMFLVKQNFSNVLADDALPSLFYHAGGNDPISIVFSYDGKYVTILRESRPWPELIEAPARWSSNINLGKRTREALEPSQASKRHKSILKDNRQLSTIRQTLESGCVGDNRVMVREYGTTNQKVALTGFNQTRQVEIRQADSDSVRVMKVLSLPASLPIRSSRITVSMPPRAPSGNEASSHIRTILTSRSQTTYESGDSSSSMFPLVVRKDIRAVCEQVMPAQIEGLLNSSSTDDSN